MVRYGLEERIFIYENYIKTKSIKKCRKNFRKKYPLGKVPNKSAILQLYKRVREKGTVWKSNESHRPQKVTMSEEKMDEIGAQLEQCPEKSLARVAKEANISESSAWRATKLLLRTASEFKEKLQEVKREADQKETDGTQKICQVYIPEADVKIEKMDEDEEEEEEDDDEEEDDNDEVEEKEKVKHSLDNDLFTTNHKYEIMDVKKEPASDDENVNDGYLPTLKAEEINVKKEEVEEHYDTEAGNTTSL